MGKTRPDEAGFTRAFTAYVPSRGPATARAERQAALTGVLHPLIDPAGFGGVRQSLMRFEQRPDNLQTVTVGTPVPSETRVDTTGSMGGNVDVALHELSKLYGLTSKMLPRCDLQVSIGIFGDVYSDRWPLGRPQFEMTAEKLVEQLTRLVPERRGGDFPEDPHYGLFGAAYLTHAYINRIGQKRYDFTVSDAPARDSLDSRYIKSIFGHEVYDRVKANGHEIPEGELDTADVVRDLLKDAHAFFLQVKDERSTTRFWSRLLGPERVVALPKVCLLPQVQASIVGLTEGTLDLESLSDFLRDNGVSKNDTEAIRRSVINIPLGAQAALPNFDRRPQKGDVFREKTDLWPIDPNEVPSLPNVDELVEDGPIWGAEDGQL